MKKLLSVGAVLFAVAVAAPVIAATADLAAKAPLRPAKQLAAAAGSPGIAWYQGTVDAAFAQAKATNKPVFLYWGAQWCPPCNQVKATLFNRHDFIERSRLFIPVYIDGDAPGAQKLGARFKVRGYPSMLLFNAAGSEITRLPGEVDAAQYMRVLSMGLAAARPVKVLLATALGDSLPGQAALNHDDWRLLAFYSWDTDEQQVTASDNLSATLRQLTQRCPADLPEISARLLLKAVAMAAAAKEAKPDLDAPAVGLILNMLRDRRLARELFDLLAGYASQIVGHVTLADTDQRSELTAAWTVALDRLIADSSLSTADRLGALAAKINLAKLGAPPDAPAESLQAEARAAVERANRLTNDAYARQSVISAAADVLSDAGLLEESDQLLKAELKRSHSPYYFMLGLAANARQRGDKAGAIDWAQQAYGAAKGPATRLQWGVSLLRTLLELAPQDEGRIEAVARQILDELQPTPDSFYERNRYSLEKMAARLAQWNQDEQHAAVVKRLRLRMDGLCAKLPPADPAQANCRSIFAPAKAAQFPVAVPAS